MIKSPTFLFLLLFLSLPVVADSNFDRMETISEELTTLMYQAMIDQAETEGADVSNLKSAIPDTSWDEPMRAAGKCILDKYREKTNESAISAMFDKIEEMLPAIRSGGILEMDELGDVQPEGITDQQAMAINKNCGMTDLQQERMMSSGFMTALMQSMSGN